MTEVGIALGAGSAYISLQPKPGRRRLGPAPLGGERTLAGNAVNSPMPF